MDSKKSFKGFFLIGFFRIGDIEGFYRQRRNRDRIALWVVSLWAEEELKLSTQSVLTNIFRLINNPGKFHFLGGRSCGGERDWISLKFHCFHSHKTYRSFSL